MQDEDDRLQSAETVVREQGLQQQLAEVEEAVNALRQQLACTDVAT